MSACKPPGLGSGSSAIYRWLKCTNNSQLVRFLEASEEKMLDQMRTELPAMLGLASAFAVLIVVGGLANLLLAGTLCSKRALRANPHGLFVLNLACSDLLLCLITQPLNIMQLLQHHYGWPYGGPLCKAVNLLNGLNLFVSTFSISAVALERFRTIVHPSAGPLPILRCRVVVLGIWALGLLMASPMAMMSQVTENQMMISRQEWLCIEDISRRWTQLKVAYSGVTLAVQFLIPLLVLAVAHARISHFIRRRLAGVGGDGGANGGTPLAAPQPSAAVSEYRRQRCALEQRRQTRAKALLVATVAIFAVCWCPLTIVNIHLDVQTLLVSGSKQEQQQQQQTLAAPNSDRDTGGSGGGGGGSGGGAIHIRIGQGVCLLMVLLSACANPLLHGCCNRNLRKELRHRLCHRCEARNRSRAAAASVTIALNEKRRPDEDVEALKDAEIDESPAGRLLTVETRAVDGSDELQIEQNL